MKKTSPSRSSLRWGSALSVLTLALAGCAVGPDYRRPDVPVPTNWQATQAQVGTASTPNSQANWWSQFKDPVLTSLQDAAERDNPTLTQAVAAIDKARATATSARAAGLPSLSASGSVKRSGTKQADVSTSNQGSPITTRSGGLDASWELDLFGSVRRSVESANALLDARQADWQDARVSLAAEVATDYVDYRACQLKQKAYEDEATSQQETARLTSIAVKAGFTAKADGQLADASHASAKATAIAQQSECDVLVKTLVSLTGLEEPTLRQQLGQGGQVLPLPAALAVSSVPAQLLSQRPDIVVKERELASYSAKIGVAEAARYPSLSLSGAITATAVAGLSTVPWSFGPALSLPVFDGGSSAANVKSAQADYDSALASYKQSVRDAVKEVEQALVRIDSATKRESEVRASAEGYRAYYKATEINWHAGGVSLLDLETARRQAISAELSLIELQQNRVDYWIALYKALGGGWRSENTSADTVAAKDTLQ